MLVQVTECEPSLRQWQTLNVGEYSGLRRGSIDLGRADFRVALPGQNLGNAGLMPGHWSLPWPPGRVRQGGPRRCSRLWCNSTLSSVLDGPINSATRRANFLSLSRTILRWLEVLKEDWAPRKCKS